MAAPASAGELPVAAAEQEATTPAPHAPQQISHNQGKRYIGTAPVSAPAPQDRTPGHNITEAGRSRVAAVPTWTMRSMEQTIKPIGECDECVSLTQMRGIDRRASHWLLVL